MIHNLIFTAFAGFCFIGFTTGSSVATQRCESQSDCRPSECCSRRFLHQESYCVSRRKLNEICLADEMGSTMINGKYDITCPCEGDLKCIKEKYIGPKGLLITKGMARCREPNYAGSSSYNYYYNPYNNGAYASANSYGNSNNYNPYSKEPSASANSYGNSNSNSNAYSQS